MNRSDLYNKIKEKDLSIEELTEYLWLLNKHLYKERPVTIDEFIEDPRFIKNKWPNIFPIWKDALRKIYPTPFVTPYNEILICAAAGAGKTVLATASTIYDIYRVACLKDPCSYYGLAPDTMLIFAIFSATGSTAAVNWNEITSAIESCPWIYEKLVDKRGLEKKYGSIVPVEILPGIYIQTGSTFKHSMGKAIFDGLMDEAAFGGSNKKEAQKTYNELSSRMATRFRSYSKTGALPGHLFLISSPKEANDFMQYRIEKAEKAGAKRTLIMKNISSWEANPANDSEDKFTVFVGNEFKEPKVYEEGESPSIEDMDYLIYPPISYLDDFKQNLIESIMNYGGITTLSDVGLFKSPSLLNSIMVLDNPFTMDTLKIPFDKNDRQIMDFMKMDYFKNIRHPEANRFIHLDIAYSGNTLDRYGIASGYCTINDRTIFREIEKGYINKEDLLTKAERTYYIDFAIGLEPYNQQEVPLNKAVDFILFLMKKLNYPIISISADTFQSKQTLQTFEEKGYEVKSISVDRSRDPYLFLKTLVSNQEILLPKNAYLKKELLSLRDDGKKIDHPIGGCFTKDTKIRLVDGRDLTIEELMIEQKHKKNYVYTFNKEKQIIEPKPIKKVFYTKDVQELVRVTIDGSEIYCTKEHPFMLIYDTFVEAKDLRPGILLKSLTEIKEVQNIEFINKCCKVYDLEIEDNHNFALSAGVFVHNSKDIADGVAGCIWNCANSKNILNISRITKSTLNEGSVVPLTEKEQEILQIMEFERLKQATSRFFKKI